MEEIQAKAAALLARAMLWGWTVSICMPNSGNLSAIAARAALRTSSKCQLVATSPGATLVTGWCLRTLRQMARLLGGERLSLS